MTGGGPFCLIRGKPIDRPGENGVGTFGPFIPVLHPRNPRVGTCPLACEGAVKAGRGRWGNPSAPCLYGLWTSVRLIAFQKGIHRLDLRLFFGLLILV